MVNLFIEGQLIDQYADESVEVISSVLDVQDITKNTGDYSKSFTVPTSKRNNKVFKHWYNATIDGGFDARTRVKGTIDIDGVPFKSGKWLLRAVKIVKGVPDSYEINFFGETASLQQILGKDVLRDLDLTSFNHAYTVAEVKAGLEVGLFGGDVIYTPMAQKGMIFADTSGDIVDSNGEVILRNIAWAGTGSGLQYEELRPSLKVIKIIEAIETKYSITFSRDFLSTTEFDDLYMWLSPDLEGKALGNRKDLINWGTTNGSWMNINTDVASYVPTGTDVFDEIDILFNFAPADYVNPQYSIHVIDNVTDEVLAEKSIAKNAQDGEINVRIPLTVWIGSAGPAASNRQIRFEVVSTESFDYTATLKSTLIESNGAYSTVENTSTVGTIVTTAGIVIDRLLPDMEITEFIKGLIQMFKLVVIGQADDTYYINSLDAYYRQGVRYDISKYLDYSGYDVQRGEILGEIDLKFQDPTSLLAVEFKDINGVGYGDSRVKLKDDAGEPFDGDTLTVELPFETIVYERLTNATTNELTLIQVGNVIDHSYAPVFTAPHLHYAHLTSISDFASRLRFQTTDIINDDIWLPMSHTEVYSPGYSLLFESEISTYTNETISNTLYSNHYENYVTAIFNVKRRTIKVSAKLPIQIITQLELNDIITINKLDYRINNYSYNLLTGITKLELINGFDKFETNEVILPNQCFNASTSANQYRFNIPFIEDYTITSSVVGGSTQFVHHSVTRNQLILDVDALGAWTDYSRRTELVFTNTLTGADEGGMCVVQVN